MINLIETPQRADIKAEYNVNGDVLTVKIGDVEEIFDLQGRGRPRTANAKVLPRQDILRRRARKVMDYQARKRLQIHRR